MKKAWHVLAGRFDAVRLAIMVASLIACIVTGTPDAFAQNYANLTKQTLDKLITSSNQLNAGDVNGARATLQSIDSSVLELDSQIKTYRDFANKERVRCVDRVAELDRRIGSIITDQQQLDAQIKQLDADLAEATRSQQLSQQEVNSLQEKMRQVQKAVSERQARLEEVRKWWWVPGYGQYLAIRTLVDDDIGQTRSLVNTLNDESSKLNSSNQALQAAQNARTRLGAERERIGRLASALPDMKADAVKRNKEIRETTVFLADAEIYWGRLQTILKNRVNASKDDLTLMRNLLEKETYPPLQAEFSDQTVTMKEAVLDFARAVDDKRDFSLDKSTDYCGGPELKPQEVASIRTHRCNIEQFTKYYRIVDPATCSFQYLSPPGCPPAPRTITVSGQSVESGAQRGVWSQADNENWVSRRRCESTDLIYYGKKNDAQQCEALCKSDTQCKFWTFNRNNGHIGTAIHECWGAKAAIQPIKGSWGGYVSGGY